MAISIYVFIVWILFKKLYSEVLATFADHHTLPSSLLEELSMDKRDTDPFISRRLVCRSSDGSCNTTA
jgi:hypothetical protein